MAIVSFAVVAACLAVGAVLFFLIRREIRVAQVGLHDQVSQMRAQLTEVGKIAGAAASASSSALDYVRQNMVPRMESAPPRAEPPPVATSRPIAVHVGAEVVELDADIVARIEALTEDFNEERVERSMLERLIQAGLQKVEDQAPDSGARGNDTSAEGMNDNSSADTTPTSPVDPTKLHPRSPRPKKK